MLTGIYATQAVIEICSIEVPQAAVTAMAHDRARFEAGVGLGTDGGVEAYEKIKANVVTTNPDCAEGSTDRKNVEAVLSIYAGT